MSRKQALDNRASLYADYHQHDSPHLLASQGFKDGYRAAMRDMRKQLEYPLDEDRDTVGRIRQFLKPLR